MDFDVEKIKQYYVELLRKKDEAVAFALVNKEEKVRERFEAVKAELAIAVEKELIEEAEKPYIHDIELCEKFFADPVEEPNPETETNNNEGE